MCRLENIFISLLLAAVIVAPSVRADTDSAQGSTPTPSLGRGKRGGGKHSATSAGSKSPGTIQGSCTVIESPSNPIAGPCVTLLLILNDADGNEVVKDRTTVQGKFEFIAELGKPYTLVSGSRYYEIVAPKMPIHGGDRVDLRLQQK